MRENPRSAYVVPPREPTVEEAKRFVARSRIEIGVSSTPYADKDSKGNPVVRGKVTTVVVTNESEMKPELVLHGPRRRGETNAYVGIDGHKHYFNAQTGEAIGSNLRPIPRKGFVDPMRLSPESR